MKKCGTHSAPIRILCCSIIDQTLMPCVLSVVASGSCMVLKRDTYPMMRGIGVTLLQNHEAILSPLHHQRDYEWTKLGHYLAGSGRANRLDGYRLRVGKIMALKVERHIDQRNHHGHFHQRPDHRREGGSGVDAKY